MAKRKRAVRVADLHPSPGNPRQVTPAALSTLRGSMDKYGDLSGIVFNRRTRRLIGGHQRLKNFDHANDVVLTERLAKANKQGTVALGYIVRGAERWSYREVDVDKATEQEMNLRANVAAGTFDKDKLSAALTGLRDQGRDLSLLGFDAGQLRQLVRDALNVIDPPAPDLPKRPKSKVGQIYELGPHRLLCGDAGDKTLVARLFDTATAALVMTSPPYNVGMDYNLADDRLKRDAYLAMLRGVIALATDRLMAGGFIAWNIGVSPKTLHFTQAQLLADAGLTYYRQIVWHKAGVAFPIWQFTTESGQARKFHPNYTHELIYLFEKGELPVRRAAAPAPRFDPIYAHELIYLFTKGDVVIGGPCDVDDQYSRDVWSVHQSQSTRDVPGATDARRPPKGDVHGGFKVAAHPAAFPIGIPAGCIKHLTARGEKVYDPFAGSGTTLMACEQLERACYAAELDPAYCDVIRQRYADFVKDAKLSPTRTLTKAAPPPSEDI